MRIPSPDAILIAAADRVLGIPQRRGVPLPALLAGTQFAPAVGCLCVSATLFPVSQALLIPPWLGAAAYLAILARANARRLLGLARSWGPDDAAGHRAAALHEREARAPFRAGLLLILLAQVVIVVANLRFGADAAHLANVSGYLVLGLCLVTYAYARCAMPRDPDLKAPAPAPHAA